jgi:4-hydroxy-tetrahydrodipicolinate reductase
LIKVGLVGGSGRVGQRIIRLIEDTEDLKLSALYVNKELSTGIRYIVTSDMKKFLDAVDLVIDFSLPEATEKLLEGMIQWGGKALVSGTTGFSPHQQELLDKASKSSPILHATNMSLGVAVLNKVVEEVSNSLRDFDIEILEMHHRHKKDSPSGTALTLAESTARGRGLDLDSVRVSGRDGNIGERTSREIAVMALRGGDIVGRHTVGFYNDGEFLEFNHTATSRDTFAKGAIRAGRWLVGKENGLYNIASIFE